MRTVKLDQASIATLLEDLLKRSPGSYGEYEASVAEILENVREKKDERRSLPTRRNLTMPC